jgi:hypothetical protein
MDWVKTSDTELATSANLESQVVLPTSEDNSVPVGLSAPPKTSKGVKDLEESRLPKVNLQ